MDEWTMDDDELTDDDLDFLKMWEEAGKNPDKNESFHLVEGETLEGDMAQENIVDESEKPTTDGTGEPDSDSDETEPSESGDVDESKMDISDVEDDDHLEGDDNEDHDIQDGESDLDFDDLDYEDEEEDEESEVDDDYAPEQDDELIENYNNDTDHEHDQVEDEFEGDERGNTDEEIEDLDEYEREREENKSESDPKAEENTEPEPLTESPDENQQEPEEQFSGEFENLPEAGDLCSNHCEDNLPEDSLEESCPHCAERIRKERELHGAVATDMNGHNLLPGDRVRVKIPIAMIAKDGVVTVNVPNSEVDPQRLAVNLKGEIDVERCWLGGKAVSQFTGWRMSEVGNSIWTFKKGAKISFVEKIGEPGFDEQDPEKMMEQFKNDLDNLPETENTDAPEAEEEEIQEGEDSSEDSEGEEEGDIDDEQRGGDDAPDEDEAEEEQVDEELSEDDIKRFERLTNITWMRILGTFDGFDAQRLTDVGMFDQNRYVSRGGVIVFNGITHTFGFAARKTEPDDIEGIEEWHRERNNGEDEDNV